jgi:cytochrome c553
MLGVYPHSPFEKKPVPMMKRAILFTTLLCGLPALASAAGDAGRGEGMTAACAACHGADGNSAAGAFPKLAGQNQRYLVKQMKDVQSGARAIPQMVGQLDGMSEQDLEDIAAYYAAQTPSIGQADPDLVVQGESIYRAGIASKGVAACTACHSPTGQGNGPAGYPRLGGQHAEYTVAQLEAFRLGADQPEKGRTNDGDSRIMRDIASRLSDLEIDAVAAYISGLYP